MKDLSADKYSPAEKIVKILQFLKSILHIQLSIYVTRYPFKTFYYLVVNYLSKAKSSQVIRHFVLDKAQSNYPN
jgi:hypothetical protein